MERITPLLTFLACCVTAAISNNITPERGFAAVIWPPIGISIAGLMIETRKTLFAIFLASLLFNFRTFEPYFLLYTLIISMVETLAALVGVSILKQIKNFDWSFGQTEHVIKFLLKVVIPSSVIAPIIGSPLLFKINELHKETFLQNFFTWWLGNALGVAIFTPFVLIISKDAIFASFKRNFPEYVLICSMTILACSYLFIDIDPIVDWMPQVVRRIYLLFPLIIWCAVRFAPVGTAILLQVIAAFATYGAVNNSAVFAGSNSPEAFNSVQLYLGFLSASGFLVTAHVTQSTRNEVRFRSMFEMAGAPSALVAKNGQFKLVNEQFCKMIGYTQEELLQKKFADITHPDDVNDNVRLFKSLMAGQTQNIHLEKRYISKNGDTIWCQIDAALINHSAPEDVTSIAIVQDITTRKIAELAAEKAKKDAEDSNRAKTEFLAFMSHEIRTPLGVILGFAEILRDKSLDQKLRDEFAETIHRNALELGALIDDVLDISKVEAGRVELNRDTIDLTDLIRDIKGTFSLQAEHKNILLELSIEDDVVTSIISDHKVLRQILVNVVGNAVKYTDKGHVILRVSQASAKDTNNSSTIFRITDTGCGISQDERCKIFTPFGQTKSPSTQKLQRTGLGLVLSKKLARLLGGDLELQESTPGQGSTFVVTIESGPLNRKAKNLPETTARKDNFKTSTRNQLDGLEILVAEDTADQALLIKFLLTDAGASVELVNNGAGAVEKSLSSSFDLVLLDMQMPILDGFDTARILRRQGFKKPIIALTAQALKSDAERAIQSGCDRHLSKPFTQERLVHAIYELLSHSEPT